MILIHVRSRIHETFHHLTERFDSVQQLRAVLDRFTPYRLSQRLDRPTCAQLVRNYQDGNATTQLTQMYGVSKASVLNLLREAGVPLRCPGLDDDQTGEAIRLYASGFSLTRVGERIGFGPTSVTNALVRRRRRAARAWLAVVACDLVTALCGRLPGERQVEPW
jgi:hypothetical protein